MTHEHELTRPVLTVLNESLLGELSTTDVRERVKQLITLDADDLKRLKNRGDCAIDQTIRNIKCHRESDCNPFGIGLLEVVPGGFRITEKGRHFLKESKANNRA